MLSRPLLSNNIRHGPPSFFFLSFIAVDNWSGHYRKLWLQEIHQIHMLQGQGKKYIFFCFVSINWTPLKSYDYSITVKKQLNIKGYLVESKAMLGSYVGMEQQKIVREGIWLKKVRTAL